jgi:hypothetical protein
MKKILLFSICAVLGFALAHAAKAADVKPANVAGVWEFAVDTTAGSGNPEFTFQQDGGKITGTYNGAFGRASLEGTVTGKDIKFTFKVDADGKKELVEYVGTVDGETMKGSVTIGTLGNGTFTGKRTSQAR